MRKLTRRIGVTAAAALAALGVVTTVATPAQAATLATATNYGQSKAAFFQNSYHNGVIVYDTKADGYRATAALWYWHGGSYSRYTRVELDNAKGAGTSATFNLGFPKGTYLQLQACIQQGPSGFEYCGPAVSFRV